MKAQIFTTILIAALTIISHEASAAPRQYSSPHNATFAHKRQAMERHGGPAVELQPEVTGVLPRAIRRANPLQILNPLAPREYGTAEENVVLDPNVPGKWDGIKLLSISF